MKKRKAQCEGCRMIVADWLHGLDREIEGSRVVDDTLLVSCPKDGRFSVKLEESRP